MTTVTVRTPSFARFCRLFLRGGNESILRCLEYERLSNLGLTGRVLDFGGGAKANYAKQVPQWGDASRGYVYESANIDPRMEPTFLLGSEGRIPVESSRYDAVVSLNTFEHVYDLDATLSEITRVMRSGSRLIFVVPFIFRVHGHPDDYLRGTPSFWMNTLAKHGLGGIEIEVVNWGPFSTASTVSSLPGPFKRLRRTLLLLLDLLYVSVRYGQDVTLYMQQDAPLCNAPIGYLVVARKD